MRGLTWLWLGVFACSGRPGGGCMQPLNPNDVQVVVCAEEDMAPDSSEDWDDETVWDTGWTTHETATDTGSGWGESDTGW